jgi:hypothetical protein
MCGFFISSHALYPFGGRRWEAAAAEQPRDGGGAAEQRVAVALEACCDEVEDLGEKLAGDEVRRACIEYLSRKICLWPSMLSAVHRNCDQNPS